MTYLQTPDSKAVSAQTDAKMALPVLVASLASIAFLIGMHLVHGTDYVGVDNDDVMRLVQVRDLMAGQSWFDLTQYRLGLESGTPMHWSRLIDAPIALLIGLFTLFMDAGEAEVAALFVWPLLLVVPLFVAIAAAGRNFGDRPGMYVALFLGAFFLIVHHRFRPGALDHHNVQLVLVMLMMAGITNPRLSGRWCTVAGVSAALAIAIGAETMPVVAVACAAMAVMWAVLGSSAQVGARSFGLSFAATLAACFYLTTPPVAYGSRACDAFSGGFYLLGTTGGALLFILAARFSEKSRHFRLSALFVGGACIAAAAAIIVPACLQSPLADLDPMLRTMWLDKVSEARSVVSQARFSPENLGRIYAVPLIALMVCFWQVRRGHKSRQHLVFAAVIGIAFAISLVQVRGSFFANILAIIPLSALVAEKQSQYRKDNRIGAAALQYGFFALISMQLVWSVGGLVAVDGVDSIQTHATEAEEQQEHCADPHYLSPLAGQPTGVVSAVSNLGSDMLRHTGHRVLSAPYHRNQNGMLTQLRIAMSDLAEAEAIIRKTGVTIVAFCPSDPEAKFIAKEHPDSLYAALARGQMPEFLIPVSETLDNPVQLYRVAD